jgi:molybdopterin molybdotransferase
MLTVEQALDAILGRAHRLEAESTPLAESLGHVLAENVTADTPMPPFDNSAVDGYAVIHHDTTIAMADAPVTLRVLGEIPAGAAPGFIVEAGAAVRIMTGAPMPLGANSVVMVEDTAPGDEDTVAIMAQTKAGENVRYAGADVPRGSLVVHAGARIRAAEIAMLAAAGRPHVQVYRPPQVAVVSTGDEVVEIEAGAIPPPGKIRDSNRYALAAMVRECGAVVCAEMHIPDDPAATEEALNACVPPKGRADVIVTAGGVSVGDRDFVRPAVRKLGRLDLWRVAMKPGKPLAFGSVGDALFFGLPGNPVSAMVTFELFVRPALMKMAGRQAPELERRQVQAILSVHLPHTPGRREYVRANTVAHNGKFITRPTGAQGSNLLHSMTNANSLIVVPQDSPAMEPGSSVVAILLD